MTGAERRLLLWCAIMLVREKPLTPAEVDEIDHLISDVRSALPKIAWEKSNIGRVVE